MDISERDQYLIDKYLRSTLDSSEEEEFNRRYKDEAFRERFNLHKDLLNIMMTDERIATKRLVQNWEVNQSEKKPIRRLWYGVAAAAAGLLILALLFWPKQALPEDLFARYYTHFPDAISQTTRTSSPTGQTSTLMLTYNQKKWKEAVPLMESHLQKYPGDQAVRLYYALSLLNLAEVERAKSQFDIVVRDSSDPDFRSAANWYRALSFIKLDQRKEAMEALRNMIDQNHYQSDDAKELLEKINAN